ERAAWVTSVCTGSLILGAAGLLRGYRATSHWCVRDAVLPLLGAEPVAERVVIDRNRMTGAGISAGLDLGLALAARLRGPAYARTAQLVAEYAPVPPFRAGTPAEAGPEVVGAADAILADLVAGATEAARR
ncbi:DJ-1/PfpI family protein, partial [Methylobacterium sp. E-065]|uniref:DJ-1/PfpI family protein n=1 Tax=Methylobacterium sp. E-065 TaxID=2836583 RepID=UPI001FBBBDE7